MEGTQASVLRFGGHPQRGLQNGFHRYEPVSRRFQQPESEFHPIGLPCRARRGGTCLSAGQIGVDCAGKPYPQHLLPAKRSCTVEYLAQRGFRSAVGQHQPRNHRTSGTGNRLGRHGHTRTAATHPRARASGRRLLALPDTAQQRLVSGRTRYSQRHQPNRAAASARRLDDKAKNRPLFRLQRRGRRICRFGRHGRMADQSVFRTDFRPEFPRARR